MEEDEPKYATFLPDYLDVTVNYKTFYWGVIIFIVILIILCLVLAITGVHIVRQGSTINETDVTARGLESRETFNWLVSRESFTRHHDPGSTSMENYTHINDGVDIFTQEECENVPYRKWKISAGGRGKCNCIAPFWGESCQREGFSSTFKALGHISPETQANLNYLKEEYVHRQSFPFEGYTENVIQTTCDNLCLSTQGCHGYVLDRTAADAGTNTTSPTILCKLLGSQPSAEGISFDPHIESNIFLNRRVTDRPKLEQQVFLYSGELKNRFWLEQRVSNSRQNMINIGLERLNQLNFYPESSINDGNAFIVFSYKHFSLDEAQEIVNLHKEGKTVPGWYVHEPNVNGLTPPFAWTTGERNYWVMAILPNSVRTVQAVRRNNPVSKSRKKLRQLARRGYELTESDYTSPEVTGEYTGFGDDSHW